MLGVGITMEGVLDSMGWLKFSYNWPGYELLK